MLMLEARISLNLWSGCSKQRGRAIIVLLGRLFVPGAVFFFPCLVFLFNFGNQFGNRIWFHLSRFDFWFRGRSRCGCGGRWSLWLTGLCWGRLDRWGTLARGEPLWRLLGRGAAEARQQDRQQGGNRHVEKLDPHLHL